MICKASTRAAVTPTIQIWRGWTRSSSKKTSGGTMPALYCIGSTPQMSWMAERSISMTPKEAMTLMMVGRRRKGL